MLHLSKFELTKTRDFITPISWSIACYSIATLLICLANQPNYILSVSYLLPVAIFIFIFGGCYYIANTQWDRNKKILTQLILVFASLSFLYKQTGFLNTFFLPNWDTLLMKWDEQIFGFQPAKVFSERFPQVWFSELMFFGYFSYYIMPVFVMFGLYKLHSRQLMSFGFVLITSFLLYYLIFIFFPAYGPQFFWNPKDAYIPHYGIFGKLVHLIQQNGEAPTAAFPSSHVGISIIVILWLMEHQKNLIKYILPTSIILCFSTVYLKAHYAVDVLAGFISAPVIYGLCRYLYKLNFSTHEDRY